MRRTRGQGFADHHACLRPRINRLQREDTRHDFAITRDPTIGKLKGVRPVPNVIARSGDSKDAVGESGQAGEFWRANVIAYPRRGQGEFGQRIR